VEGIESRISRQVRAAVGQRRDELVALLQGMVRASRDGDDATQAFVAEKLDGWGCEVETIREDPTRISVRKEFRAAEIMDSEPRTTVMARLRGAGGGRSLMLWAHPDSVTVANTEVWRHDPFGGDRENGRIYGWGVADDKSGVAAGMAAVRLLQELDLRPRGDVVIGSCASKRRAQGVVAAFDRGYLTDGSVYLHPAESGHGLDDIKAVSAGILWFRVVIEGKPPLTTEPNHVTFAHLAVNPIEKLGPIVAGLKALEQQRAARLRHVVLEEAMGQSTRLTFGTVHAEAATPTRIPERCELGVAMAIPPGEPLEAAKRDVEQALEALASGDPWLREHPPRVEWLFGTEGVELPEGHALVETVRQALMTATDRPPSIYALHASSDIRVPMHYNGTPCVGFGPLAGDSSQIGKADEWVDEEDYLRMVEACALTILDWCGYEA
jgi:acetylornithine deacetylase